MKRITAKERMKLFADMSIVAILVVVLIVPWWVGAIAILKWIL